MKDSRIGECLWEEWEGSGFDEDFDTAVFFTIGHVSLEEDVVRRALASSIQRDGIVDSLGDAYKILEKSETGFYWGGYTDSDIIINVCDDSGVTEYGDFVDDINPITIVKF